MDRLIRDRQDAIMIWKVFSEGAVGTKNAAWKRWGGSADLTVHRSALQSSGCKNRFQATRYRRDGEMGKAAELTDANFRNLVLESDQPVLVDFWAPWCGPCRQIAPLIDELAVAHAGSVLVGKVNVDDNPEVATAYGIQSIPTLMIFRNGEVVERFVGMPPRSKLEAALGAT
jgi:thioredoxin 1